MFTRSIFRSNMVRKNLGQVGLAASSTEPKSERHSCSAPSFPREMLIEGTCTLTMKVESWPSTEDGCRTEHKRRLELQPSDCRHPVCKKDQSTGPVFWRRLQAPAVTLILPPLFGSL